MFRRPTCACCSASSIPPLAISATREAKRLLHLVPLSPCARTDFLRAPGPQSAATTHRLPGCEHRPLQYLLHGALPQREKWDDAYRNLNGRTAFFGCRVCGADMDDHTFFLLKRIESDIRRAYLVLEQLRIHVAELPPQRSSEARRWLSRAHDELDRHFRIRAALLEPNPGTYIQ